MKNQLIELIDLKQQQDKLANEYASAKKEFDYEHEKLKASIDDVSAMISVLKNEITGIALEEYKITNNKHLIGGIGIRIQNRLHYEDAEALDWAKQHNMALKLNKSEFEKIAKIDKPNFVEFKEDTQVTFPKEIKL